MPYDPRMLQMTRAGIGMMAPEPSPFDRADPSQAPNRPKQPPSMFDMMMDLGRMTPQQYNQRIHGAPPGQQQGQAQVSPWAWLGGLGGGYK